MKFGSKCPFFLQKLAYHLEMDLNMDLNIPRMGYGARLRGGPPELFLLLLTTSALFCLQPSRNLGTTF